MYYVVNKRFRGTIMDEVQTRTSKPINELIPERWMRTNNNTIWMSGYQIYRVSNDDEKTFPKAIDFKEVRAIFLKGKLKYYHVEKPKIQLLDNNTFKPEWLKSGWFDGIEDFWQDFSEDGMLEVVSDKKILKSDITLKSPTVGSIAAASNLKPGQEKEFECNTM